MACSSCQAKKKQLQEERKITMQPRPVAVSKPEVPASPKFQAPKMLPNLK